MVDAMLVDERTTDTDLVRARPVFVLRSRIPGRDRWEIPPLINEPRHALAVQTILAGEPGILSVQANEVTGRVLFEYDPQEIQDSIENLLQKALAFGPLSEAEYQLLTVRGEAIFPAARLFLGAELGCLLFKALFLSTWCPAAGVASSLVFVLLATCKTSARTRRVVRVFASAGGIVLNEACGIDDDEDRAEVVQNRRNDRVN
jgi:Heavy metal associated domain 2